ncbi:MULTISPECIES: Fic family protein [Nocardia]|uniref:Fic family protein n=1 Tax=Nocardia TaxID=1817 RepID=UPI0007E93E57|nr:MULTISPECIES: Fic family protein [Nocardia]MBF6272370.1 Fic family protein [Nocardia nova]OBA41502.1 cell filamentation protein Fic [Nocardia sp. 852002-51101_SCH5132738]OBB40622.1 cell filamentation protein Fic [Nocardia sp. 852002-51244_SCH5132740]OBF84077.1 cell filamentation protein Fic [Mycobacterium sp. 852002-51759_SCH5129042]
MAKVVRQHWTGNLDAGLSRKDRGSGSYEAYVPDRLVGRSIVLDSDTAADVVDAEVAVHQLDSEANALVETEALSRLLLRAEAIASSRIEGLEIGAQRLLRAEAARQAEGASSDVTAVEVLANIDAMAVAANAVAPDEPITEEILLEVHRRLLAGTNIASHGGELRTVQNWIGGSSYNPCSADFVPPPPEYVPELIRDLIDFCNSDDLPAVAQAAIAHAQFETIHPFIDGNGRTGRALIHLILRRRGVAERVVAPVSLVLATWRDSYIEALTRFRYIGAPESAEAISGLNIWVARFAAACARAVADATVFESAAADLQRSWRARVAPVRANSALDLLLGRLVGAPILTTSTAATLIGRSFPATNAAIERLTEAGILRQVTVGRRNRAFESPEAIAAFTALERRLASPQGTRTSDPSRPVPRRAQSR